MVLSAFRHVTLYLPSENPPKFMPDGEHQLGAVASHRPIRGRVLV